MHIYIYIVYFSYAIIINFFCFFINPGRDRSLLSLERLENMVRYYRRKDFSDWEAQLFAPGLSRVGGDDDRNFVRFNLKMPIDGDLVQVVSYYLWVDYFFVQNRQKSKIVKKNFFAQPQPSKAILSLS